MNSTLRAGLEVIEALWASQTAQGVSELARGLGRDKSNVHRVLATLAAHGFVNQDRASRKYRLGPAWAHRMGEFGRLPAPPAARRSDAAACWMAGSER